MKLIPNALSVKVARSAFAAHQNSPRFLFAAGVVGVSCSTVLACRATLKLSDVLEEAKNDLLIANSLKDEDGEQYVDRKKDVARIYAQSVLKVGTLYAPAVIIGGASIVALTKSHSILTHRNAGLMAAYAALDRGFGEYRGRVIEKYGEGQDREFRYASEEVDIVDEKGKKKVVTQVALGDGRSIYARFFDASSPSWNTETTYNFEFLRATQNHANDLLRMRGHLFLNEVYDILGLERSQAGAVVGWVWGNPNGDNYVDFGCFSDNDGFFDWVRRHDNTILLDFNVDGVIYDQLPMISGVSQR